MLILFHLIFLIASLESFVNCQAGLIPPLTKPSKFAYSPGCYLKDYDVMIPYTKDFSPQDGRTCAKFSCGYDGYIEITSCLKSYGKNCRYIPGDRKLAYPKCCDKMVCRKHFNAPNNSEFEKKENLKDESIKSTVPKDKSKVKVDEDAKIPPKLQAVAKEDSKDNPTEPNDVPLEQGKLNKTESKVSEDKPTVEEKPYNSEINKLDEVDEKESLDKEPKIKDTETNNVPKETRNAKSISPDTLELGKKVDEEKEKGLDTVSENQSQNNDKEKKDDDAPKTSPDSKDSLIIGKPNTDNDEEAKSDSESKDAEVIDEPVLNKEGEIEQNQKPDNDNTAEIVHPEDNSKNDAESTNANPVLNKTVNIEDTLTSEDLNKDTESPTIDENATNEELSNLNAQIQNESKSENSNKEDKAVSSNNDSPNSQSTANEGKRLKEPLNPDSDDEEEIMDAEDEKDNSLQPDTEIEEQTEKHSDNAKSDQELENNPKDEQIVDEDDKKGDESNFPESTDTKSKGTNQDGDPNIENKSGREAEFPNDEDEEEE